MFLNDHTVKAILAGGAVAVTAGAAYLGRKLSKLTKKVGMSIEDLAKAESKDIHQEIIERSVEKAAKQEVRRYAQDGANDALRTVKLEVQSQVKAAVNEAFDQLKASVEAEITAQVAAIDHQALKRDVTEQAKKKIIEKFDGNLDDILRDFSDNLSRVKKIYSSISETLSERGSGKEISFKVG